MVFNKFMISKTLLVKDIMQDLKYDPIRKEKMFKDFVKNKKKIGGQTLGEVFELFPRGQFSLSAYG